MSLFRKKVVQAYEPADSPFDPPPEPRIESYSHEIFQYQMEDFKARLGLADNPHDILVVQVGWDNKVEVHMTER
jgi:hypothetical protein